MKMNKKLRLFVIIASGCWMLGEGARMVVMALFFQDWHYSPNTFDMFFDWMPLVILRFDLLLRRDQVILCRKGR